MAELQVIKIPSLDQLGDINVPLDSVLVESLLQHLVVLNELVLMLGSPLYFAECESTWVQRIKNGAIDSTCGALLNLGQLQLYT